MGTVGSLLVDRGRGWYGVEAGGHPCWLVAQDWSVCREWQLGSWCLWPLLSKLHSPQEVLGVLMLARLRGGCYGLSRRGWVGCVSQQEAEGLCRCVPCPGVRARAPAEDRDPSGLEA